jgi:hypothetical protein
MKNSTITKATYKICKISIDHKDAGTGVGVIEEDCDLTLEISPDGEPVRLLVKNDDVNKLIKVLTDHAYPLLTVRPYSKHR